MAEMMQELQELEDEFIELRCRMRQLQGKVGMFLTQPHQPLDDYMKNPNDLTATDMLHLICVALTKLDLYEYKKGYNFERCRAWENIRNMGEFEVTLERYDYGNSDSF